MRHGHEMRHGHADRLGLCAAMQALATPAHPTHMPWVAPAAPGRGDALMLAGCGERSCQRDREGGSGSAFNRKALLGLGAKAAGSKDTTEAAPMESSSLESTWP